MATANAELDIMAEKGEPTHHQKLNVLADKLDKDAQYNWYGRYGKISSSKTKVQRSRTQSEPAHLTPFVVQQPNISHGIPKNTCHGGEWIACEKMLASNYNRSNDGDNALSKMEGEDSERKRTSSCVAKSLQTNAYGHALANEMGNLDFGKLYFLHREMLE